MELIVKSGTYSQDRADLVTYNTSLVAWPEAGTRPVKVVDLLPNGDREKLCAWKENLLREPSEAASLLGDSGIQKPYCDPYLFSSQRRYSEFILGLSSRNLVGWRCW